MNLKSASIGLVVASVVLVGCGRGSVDSREARRNIETGKVDVVRTYNLAASERSNNVYFTANFREGRFWGSDIILSEPASLLVNGEPTAEHSKIDEFDGGEVAAFYAGFVFPLFWFYMGDDGYANYSKVLPPGDQIVDIQFTDPEGELHVDQAEIRRLNVIAPQTAVLGHDVVIEVPNKSIYDNISCGIQYEKEQLVKVTTYDDQGVAIEKEELRRVRFHRTYSVFGGRIRIPAQDLMDNLSPQIDFECTASYSRNLTGASGGTLNVVYKAHSQPLQWVR